jgi:hypothetical protein
MGDICDIEMPTEFAGDEVKDVPQTRVTVLPGARVERRWRRDGEHRQ